MPNGFGRTEDIRKQKIQIPYKRQGLKRANKT
jgi:hypothetical protein